MVKMIYNDNEKYHLSMLLKTLKLMKFPNVSGDTRNYLDVDEYERKLLVNILENELK